MKLAPKGGRGREGPRLIAVMMTTPAPVPQ